MDRRPWGTETEETWTCPYCGAHGYYEPAEGRITLSAEDAPLASGTSVAGITLPASHRC
jgi:hypothetical protein